MASAYYEAYDRKAEMSIEVLLIEKSFRLFDLAHKAQKSARKSLQCCFWYLRTRSREALLAEIQHWIAL